MRSRELPGLPHSQDGDRAPLGNRDLLQGSHGRRRRIRCQKITIMPERIMLRNYLCSASNLNVKFTHHSKFCYVHLEGSNNIPHLLHRLSYHAPSLTSARSYSVLSTGSGERRLCPASLPSLDEIATCHVPFTYSLKPSLGAGH